MPHNGTLTLLGAARHNGALPLTVMEKNMAATDDLNNAVTALATGFAALDAVVQQELSAISAAVAATDPDAAAIEQAVANIGAVTSKMATDAASLTAKIPAATTVPAPASTATASPAKPAPTVAVPQITTPPVSAPTAQPTSTPPASATTTAPSTSASIKA